MLKYTAIKTTVRLAALLWALPILAFGQEQVLVPGKVVSAKLMKGANHKYIVNMHKGEYASCTVMQKGVDLTVALQYPAGKTLRTYDAPNGANGPEKVDFIADSTGPYVLNIYPTAPYNGFTDSEKIAYLDGNQGRYEITGFKKLGAAAYAAKLAKDKKRTDDLEAWLKANSHVLKTVDAGNGFEDLQPFKQMLAGVTVVGLGEATHGTSEFFRMKHRMLEFLVKEMGFNSFYIEASMSRCRYINRYVLYGKGNLDTATVIQGFVTWRVEEVRNMIEWLRQYNKDMPDSKKVKFLGIDLQINDVAWAGLKAYYAQVNPATVTLLDTLEKQGRHAAEMANSRDKVAEGEKLFRQLYTQCIDIKKAMERDKTQYTHIAGDSLYTENAMNITLIIQEIKSFKDGYNDRRDYYMAQNVLYLLHHEKPGSKVVVWAHNGHINNLVQSKNAFMGKFLKDALKDKYYPIGFEFYSGSFQSRNMDIQNSSTNWDVNTVGAPPLASLPWYLNNTGKDMLYLDLRHMGALRGFQPITMHYVGSQYFASSPLTFSASFNDFDGLIYIKNSTAAKNFTMADIKKQ